MNGEGYDKKAGAAKETAPDFTRLLQLTSLFDGNIKWNNQAGFFLNIRILLIKCTFFN